MGSGGITRKSTDDGRHAVAFAVGAVDEVYLIGQEKEKVHVATAGEEQIILKHGFAFALASGRGAHFLRVNEVVGVTDDILCVAGGRGRRLKGHNVSEDVG